jgi:death-on-curing family protein
MKDISLKEVEYVAHSLAKKTMKWDEPIPEFNTRFPNKLESCIITPFLKFNNKVFYKGLNEKAAILFYLMIKNHPFQNGNKRIAITTLLTFLYKNNKWIEVDNMKFYNFARWVASSDPEVKDQTVGAIAEFIKKNSRKL